LQRGISEVLRFAQDDRDGARATNLQTLPTIREGTNRLESAVVLLRGLIDYAGLFPPAALAMSPSVANYDGYLRSQWNWILGHFIVPAARLGEFEDALDALPNTAAPYVESGIRPATTSSANWRLSLLLGSDPAADVARTQDFIHREFNARKSDSSFGRTAIVESVEVKVATSEEVTRLSKIIPAELAAYFEVPLASAAECIAAISGCGRRAKIRTGGETADKFPTSEGVIKFIRLCAAANVPFKATAGLHHPIRSVHRFTYQPESASGIMHGFINLFLAAAFVRAGMDADVALELLEESSADAFHFDPDGVGWHEYRLSQSEIAAARRDFAVSFGSCSFTEPIEDLRSLHLL
jgi:hypothetical protein